MVVRDPDTGERVSRFIEVHERQLHLFIISRDLTRFAHVHPQRREDGTFELQHDMAAGEYMLIADFLPADGTAQLVQTVGRVAQCEIHIDDQAVSRRHCTLTVRESALVVTDLESANGTFLNEQPVKSATARPGDLIRVGSTVLEYP